MKRLTAQLLSKLRSIYYFIFRPKTRGAKCIVEHQGKILLVKLSYAHKGWTIPGGKVERGEGFEAAARREVLEEVGIRLSEVQEVDQYLSTKYYKRDQVKVFYGKAESGEVKPDSFEVSDFLWFDPKNPLPEPYSARLLRHIKIFQTLIKNPS